MKKFDLQVRFTELVNELLEKGMTFSISMRGSQGEDMKVDLTDGKNTYRVVIDSQTDFEVYMDCVRIVVLKFDRVVKNSMDTLWTQDGEVLHEEKFYKVEVRRDWYVLKEEAVMIWEKRQSRFDYDENEGNKEFKGRAFEIALKFVKRQPRCKCKKTYNIKSVCKSGGQYRVYLHNGQVFTLH